MAAIKCLVLGQVETDPEPVRSLYLISFRIWGLGPNRRICNATHSRLCLSALGQIQSYTKISPKCNKITYERCNIRVYGLRVYLVWTLILNWTRPNMFGQNEWIFQVLDTPLWIRLKKILDGIKLMSHVSYKMFPNFIPMRSGSITRWVHIKYVIGPSSN